MLKKYKAYLKYIPLSIGRAGDNTATNWEDLSKTCITIHYFFPFTVFFLLNPGHCVKDASRRPSSAPHSSPSPKTSMDSEQGVSVSKPTQQTGCSPGEGTSYPPASSFLAD